MSTVKARALVLEEPGSKPVLAEIDVLDPGPGEVRIKIAASGVCGTDGHAIEGTHPLARWPVVLGHEGAGVVESVGEGVTDIGVGDHVVCALAVPCGTCRQCRRGLAEHCNSPARRQAMSGVMADGGSRLRHGGEPAYPFFGVGTLAEYTTVRRQQAIPIDPALPLDEFCLAGCGVITGYGAVLNVAQVRPGDTVVVVGAGGVGANVIQAARAAGASTIVAVDGIPEKLDLARTFGATHTIEASRDVAAELRAIEPDGADAVFEVVGKPELLSMCLSLTRVGGACVMVGIPPMGAQVTFDAFTLNANRRLLGCRGGAVVPTRDIDRLVSLYRGGALNLAGLIGRRLGLDDVFEALDQLGRSAFARSVVVF
ncbi:zinc-binding dehydrogenase [Acrocarpospora catenulata]|uniref:zinc-binding dehydrogenase n=1 Tax=Acrocarpospora catenulata TaxID=2836182 RepID=UPI001BDAF6AA|nr:zinc-binding dehydrogenase [Acrocarpospora catenulata]